MPRAGTGRGTRATRKARQPEDVAAGSRSARESSGAALATVHSGAAPSSVGAAFRALQATAGNGAVARLLRSRRGATPQRLQPKLMVGSANDPLEREADRVAEWVMRTWSSTSATAGIEAVGEMPIRRLADRGRDPASAFEADASVAHRLAARSGGGEALPEVVRNRMEAGFGTDFGSVRIHRDAEAADLSTGLAARAFTHGADIYFAAGAYEPGSSSGRHLLAHELAHVVQQGRSREISRQVSGLHPSLARQPGGTAPAYVQRFSVEEMKQGLGSELLHKHVGTEPMPDVSTADGLEEATAAVYYQRAKEDRRMMNTVFFADPQVLFDDLKATNRSADLKSGPDYTTTQAYPAITVLVVGKTDQDSSGQKVRGAVTGPFKKLEIQHGSAKPVVKINKEHQEWVFNHLQRTEPKTLASKADLLAPEVDKGR